MKIEKAELNDRFRGIRKVNVIEILNEMKKAVIEYACRK